jgi:hypothetical protein
LNVKADGGFLFFVNVFRDHPFLDNWNLNTLGFHNHLRDAGHGPAPHGRSDHKH